MLLGNAFSLQMLTENQVIKFTFISLDEAKHILKDACTSVIGHQDLANVLTNMFGFEISCNRVNNKLRTGDKMIIAQFMGGRLPEGAVTLPAGAEIKFVLVEVLE